MLFHERYLSCVERNALLVSVKQQCHIPVMRKMSAMSIYRPIVIMVKDSSAFLSNSYKFKSLSQSQGTSFRTGQTFLPIPIS